jgi:hypothetical protein
MGDGICVDWNSSGERSEDDVDEAIARIAGRPTRPGDRPGSLGSDHLPVVAELALPRHR